MYRIYKITSDHVVDFAAEELKRYLRMMMPRCGEIDIAYDPDATEGFRLGLMSDFGLDTSEAQDPYLDDILHIDTTEEGGILAGSNPRSVLLAVYRYRTFFNQAGDGRARQFSRLGRKLIQAFAGVTCGRGQKDRRAFGFIPRLFHHRRSPQARLDFERLQRPFLVASFRASYLIRDIPSRQTPPL